MRPAGRRKNFSAPDPLVLVLVVVGAMGGGPDAWGAPITFNTASPCFREAGVGGSNPLTPTSHFLKQSQS